MIHTLKFYHIKKSLPNADIYIEKLRSKGLNDQIDFISPSVSKLAIISTKNRKEGINVKGIIESKEIDKIKSNLVEGKLNLDNENSIVDW